MLELDACLTRKQENVQSALQENGCSYSHQTLAAYAVNIYYQINKIKTFFFLTFLVDTLLRRQFGTHHACDIRLAIREVICVTSTNFTVGEWWLESECLISIRNLLIETNSMCVS